MRIQLNNIGKLSSADISIEAITVIAGENNAGKSTVGKGLFSLFQSFYDYDKKIYEDKLQSIKSSLSGSNILKNIIFGNQDDNSIVFFNDYDRYNELSKNIIEVYKQNGTIENDEISKELETDIISEIEKKLSVKDLDQIIQILNRTFKLEFNNQINNIYNNEDAEISLFLKDKNISVRLNNNNVTYLSSIMNINTEVIYIDNPLIIEDLDFSIHFLSMFRPSNYTFHHSDYLKRQLNKGVDENSVDEVLKQEKLNSIQKLFNATFNWDNIDDSNKTYKSPGKKISYKNISSGLKSFYILKRLLDLGIISNKNTLVLDEPEVHLHPEWQLIYAEILILLQKEFDLHILINTHSPYFLNAIEVYSVKHGIDNKCHYYLAENKGSNALISEVEDTEKIYQKLARPLQILENIRYEDD